MVAAESFWGNIASQIGGAHVSVTSIISDPSADPHLYESDARDAAALAEAKLVIENGVGYDDFIDKLLGATSNEGRVVLSAAKVLGVTADNANPHLWYDIPRVHEVAAAIETQLLAADPAHRADYATNLAKFDASLLPLLAVIHEIATRYPQAAVAYTERVAGYLLAAADLAVKSPAGFSQAIENGNEPSVGDTQTMNALITEHGVRVLLSNSQATSPVTEHLQDLARQSGVPVVGVSETLPAGEPDYQTWQLHQLQQLLAALGG